MGTSNYEPKRNYEEKPRYSTAEAEFKETVSIFRAWLKEQGLTDSLWLDDVGVLWFEEKLENRL